MTMTNHNFWTSISTLCLILLGASRPADAFAHIPHGIQLLEGLTSQQAEPGLQWQRLYDGALDVSFQARREGNEKWQSSHDRL
jgi:hypothetical protein